MRNSRGYILIGLSVVIVMSIFVTFSEDDEDSYDYTGIIYDIHSTSSGYRFYIQTSSGDHHRCFSYNQPVECGYYALRGTLSEDGSMLFVSFMKHLDPGSA